MRGDGFTRVVCDTEFGLAVNSFLWVLQFTLLLVSLCASVSVHASLFLFVSVSVSLCLSVSVSLALSSFSSLPVCSCLCLCPPVCLSVYLSVRFLFNRGYSLLNKTSVSLPLSNHPPPSLSLSFPGKGPFSFILKILISCISCNLPIYLYFTTMTHLQRGKRSLLLHSKCQEQACILHLT